MVKQTLVEASDAMGEDLAKLIHEGPKEALGLTTNTQPVMLVSAVAAYRVWLAEGGALPSVVAGHSLGEYSALVAAGVLTLAQAAPLVRFRAQAMQDAVPVGTGAMAAILGMDAAHVIEGCRQAQATFGAGSAEVVEAVNFNDAGQTVIAGSKAAVETVDAGVRRDLLVTDAVVNDTVCYEQVLRQWAWFNWGDPDLAPRVCHIPPPERALESEARTAKLRAEAGASAAAAVEKLITAAGGVADEVDLVAFLEECGFKRKGEARR